jgi:virulence-associated protein VagC
MVSVHSSEILTKTIDFLIIEPTTAKALLVFVLPDSCKETFMKHQY